MLGSQPQFGLHGPLQGSRNFNNFQSFNDEDVEVIGIQMPQNIEGSRNMSMRREVEDTIRKDDDISKKKINGAVTSKLEGIQNK